MGIRRLIQLAQKAVRRPRFAIKAAYRNLVAKAYPAPEARPFIEERLATLRKEFRDVQGSVRGKAFGHGGMLDKHAELLWRLVVDRKPDLVVETGVCNGVSSAVILEAMAQVGHGRLISVDLPEFVDPALNTTEFWEGKGGAVVPPGRQAGWLVPETRRDRWSLRLGRAQDLVPEALKDGADIFIHDSEHSFENQLFEFRAGWSALRPGGVLVATDINWSNAFDVFCREVRPKRLAYIDYACCLAFK